MLTAAERHDVLRHYASEYGCAYFVETGAGGGGDPSSIFLHDIFEEAWVIEIDEERCRLVVDRNDPEIIPNVIQGDSGQVLPDLLPILDKRTLFFLDAHWTIDELGKFGLSDEDVTPIVNELRSIFERNQYGHVIIIDDIRLFGEEAGYPAIDSICSLIKELEPYYLIEVKDDLLRLTPNAIV